MTNKINSYLNPFYTRIFDRSKHISKAKDSALLSCARNQKGQSLIEYLIIVAIVGIGSIAVTRSVGQNINVRMAQIVRGLGGQVEGQMRADAVSSSSYKKKDLSNFLSGARSPNANNSSQSDEKN